VLRLERGAEPDEEDVLDAAHLAAHFSPLRESTRVAVHLARRKRVHKPKGAKPGLVTLSGGRVVQLRVQPARIQRLLASARRGPPGEGGD
jgi:predicted ribosome quality control (RQC) complex YloA/Tae2 family protein